MKRNAAFTIIELLAVLVILGVIMAITVPTISYFLRGNSKDYYSKLEKTVASSSQDFFNDYRVNLPKDIGNVKRIGISTLVSQKYTTEVLGIDKKGCDGDVVVQKLTNGNYSYTTCLKCEKKKDGSYGYTSTTKECGYSEENNNRYTILIDGLKDATSIRIPQAVAYTIPKAKVYVNGQVLSNELKPTPSTIDVNVLTTYKIYYTFRTLVKELQIKVYDPKKPVVTKIEAISGGVNLASGTFTNKDVTVRLSATDWTTSSVYGSGVDHFEYQINGGSIQKINALTTDNKNYTAAFNLTVSGTHNITAKAIDKEGNISDTKTFVVKIDKVKPSGTITLASTKSGYNALSVKTTLSASDNAGGSGVKQMCIQESNNVATCNWSNFVLTKNITLSGSLNGKTRTVYVWFKDGASNISDIKSTTYTTYLECSQVNFSAWSSCNKVCGGGSQTRMAKDKFTSNSCSGKNQSQSCNTMDCCGVNKVISSYTTWSPCNKTCGKGTQTRTVYYKSRYDSNISCGSSVESKECNGTNCEAILNTGQSVSAAVNRLIGKSNVKYIKTTSSVPSGVSTETVSTSNSILIQIYFDSASSTLYFASTAAKIYMNSDSSMLFYKYTNLINIDFGKFDTSKVTNMRYMFRESNMKSLDLRSFDTRNVTIMKDMFYQCWNLESINFGNFNTSKVTRMDFMFAWCGRLKSLDLSSFNTSQVTDMSDMFYGCSSLTTLNLSNFDTRNLTSMFEMFFNCEGLTSLNISSFNTSKVTTMIRLFSGCKNLKSLNLSNFNTSQVTSMENMFYGCSSLTSLNVSSFNTAKVTNMSGMFNACWSLTSLNVGSFNTSQVKDFSYMFNNCSGLTSLDVSRFYTTNAENMLNMFTNCYRLTSLNISNFDTRKVKKFGAMFAYTNGLRTITYGANFVYQNNAILSAYVSITNVTGSVSMYSNTPANKPTHSSWSGKI